MRIDSFENFRGIEEIVNEMMDDDRKQRTSNDTRSAKTTSKNFMIDKSETYQEIMKKEDRVIDLMEDIHTYKKEKDSNYKFLTTSPLYVIIYRLYKTVNDIGKELRNASDFNDVVNILIRTDRVVYTGIVLVLFSIIMLLLISL